MAYLKVIEGANPGQIVELIGDRMVMGRHPSCEIVLDNAAVSRHHAQVLHSHGNYYLEDLRSRNRTFLNEIAIEGRTELHDKDTVKVCDVAFTFHSRFPGDASSSHHLSGTGSTASGAPSTAPPAVDPKSDSQASSIISTINAKTGTHLRLSVKPEIKLRALLSISRALAKTLRLDDVLQRTLDELFKVFPQAEEGFCVLKDPETGKPAVRATKTRTDLDDDSVRVSLTIVEKAMREGEAILSQDAVSDTQFDHSDSISKLRIRSMMCVPLLDLDGKALGVIQLDARDLRDQFSNDDLDLLVSVATPIALAVDNARLHQQVLRQRQIEQEQQQKSAEMTLAMHVQHDFLPQRPPDVDGYEFSDAYEPANEVGGDYFDYIEMAGGRIAVPLGDVAGKGVPAALLMAKLSSSARSQLLSKPSISEALATLNAELSSGGLGHRFITLSLLVIDPRTHEVTVANAGHPPAFLRRSDGTVEEIGDDVAGTPLGVVTDQQFETSSLSLQPGEFIVQYSDGVSEAMDAEEHVYGRGRLGTLLERDFASAQAVVDAILEDVDDFRREATHRDDLCLVVIRRSGKPKRGKSRKS